MSKKPATTKKTTKKKGFEKLDAGELKDLKAGRGTGGPAGCKMKILSDIGTTGPTNPTPPILKI